MRHISTTGIIIKKRNIGEHDQYVTFYSPDFGSIEAAARGARKINSSFIGHIEVLNVCKFQLYKSPRGFTLTQCQMQQSFRKVRENMELTMFSFLILEIFHTIAREENARELYDLLHETLERLNQNTKNLLYLESFKIKILNMAGYLPDTLRCSHCHKKWQEDDQIQLTTDGEILCDACVKKKEGTSIPFKIIKLIHFAAQSPYSDIAAVRISEEESKLLKKITDTFLQSYISPEFKSQTIINHLHASPPARSGSSPDDQQSAEAADLRSPPQ